MATLDDLRDALTQLAAEADVEPGHAESAVADARDVAVAPANTTRNRGPILAVAAAVTLLAIVAGILLALREPDAILITDDSTPAPTTSEPDAVESSLRSSGVYDRGQDQTLTLDPDSDERLRGVVVATLDGDADAIAVATDGALGVLEGTTLRIVADGEELAARDFASSFGEFGRPTSPAFDVEGTLWAWTGDGVAGLRRDGSNVDVEKAVPPITVPGQEAQLRISGTNVSVMRYDGNLPARVEVVSVVGSDPLAGVRNVETPVPRSGQALPPGVPYSDGLRTIVTSEWLLTGSIVGSTTAELQWRDLPDDSLGYGGSYSEAPIIADTAASLSWMNIFDGAFLAVHRSDGTAAVAVVEDPGERFEVAVSPDGAVHLVTRVDGSITVRTLLDADLRPLQGPPAPTAVAPQTPAEALAPLECGEPQRGVQVVDDVDLDADGAADRVTIDGEGVVLACLADGRQAAVAAFPSSTLARADLGGRDGVIVTLAPGPGIDFHTQNYLFRYRDGELQVLGYLDGTNVSGLPDVRGLVHVFAGEDFPSGENVDQSTPGSFGVFGCRPSGIPDFDFDLTTLIHYPDGRLYSETRTFDAEWSVQMSLDTIAAELVPKWPATASRAELDQVLRDAGFAPGCLPVGPDDEPLTPGPTLEPTSIADVCDQEQEWDIRLDLDGDGSTDHVTLAARTVDAWGQLVACLADGSTTALAVGPGLDLVRVGWLALRPIDLAGTPGVALVRLLGSERDSGEYEVFVLRDQELVALTPNEASGAFGGALLDLRLWGNTRVETFGCRPTNRDGVEIVELLIEQVDRDISDDIASPVYGGDGMELSYVVRAVTPDWSGIDGPGERTELPLDPGEAVSPAEILAGLDAVWLCAP